MSKKKEIRYNPSKQGDFACRASSGQLIYGSIKHLLKDDPNAQDIIRCWLDRDSASKQKKSNYKDRDLIVALKYLIFSTPEAYTRCIIRDHLSDQWKNAIQRCFRVTADVELTSLLAVKCQVRRDAYYRRVKRYVANTKRKQPLRGATYMRAYDRLIDGEVDLSPGIIEREVVAAMSQESTDDALVRDWDKEREIFEATGEEPEPIYCWLPCPKVHRLHPSLESAGWSYPRRRNGGVAEYSELADPKMENQDLDIDTDPDAQDWWIEKLTEAGFDAIEIHSKLNLKCAYHKLEQMVRQLRA